MARNGWKIESTWLQGRTVLVTGATSGIGRATVQAIAPHLRRLLIVGRNSSLVQDTTAALAAEFPALEIHGFTADLALQAETRKVAEWALSFPELHGLVNNVGAVMGREEITVDGIERQFAINYVNQVLLTRLLLPRLAQNATPKIPHRIVMVSSRGHRSAKPLSTEFTGLKPYSELLMYRQSKLAQSLFTKECARRLQGWPVTINAVCPGATRTDIGCKNTQNAAVRWVWWLASRFFQPVEVGTANVVKVLADDTLAGTSGEFFENFQPSWFAPLALDPAAAKLLWDETCDRLQLPRELAKSSPISR